MSGATDARLVWTAVDARCACLRVDGRIYSEEAVLRACYLFTDRCYLFLERDGDAHLTVHIKVKSASGSAEQLQGAFANELINQRIRISLAQETRAIRERIVERAFADADVDG